MSLDNTIKYIPGKLQDRELNVKFTEILDFILNNACTDLEDVSLKFRGQDTLRSEVVFQILDEMGLEYLSNLLSTTPNVDLNSVLSFASLIFFLKGHRDGFELVLNLMGFNFQLEEWWERNPKGEPDTYKLVVDIIGSEIPSIFETFYNFKIFARNYIYPVVDPLELNVTYDFFDRSLIFGGFHKKEYVAQFEQIITNAMISGFVEKQVYSQEIN